MPLDVFQLRDSVVGEYRDYVKSFVQVLDERIDEYVNRKLDEGALWPDAVLQLNPAFEMDRTPRRTGRGRRRHAGDGALLRQEYPAVPPPAGRP